MHKHLVGVVLTIFLMPGVIVAQTPESRIDAARDRVSQAGIPVALIEERIAEGRAKGVPEERIAEAVERRANALLAAGTALPPTSASLRSAELAAGADAVEAGIPADALRRVVSGARAADRAVALAVLTFLHQERGLPVETALARVTEALAKGPDALRDLPARSGGGANQGRGNGPPEAVGAGARRGSQAPAQRPGQGRPEGAPPPGQRPPQGGSRQ